MGQVRRLMARVAAEGHQSFGGRLEPDAPGFMAHAMAKKLAGDRRDPQHVTRWTTHIADHLAPVSPTPPDHGGRRESTPARPPRGDGPGVRRRQGGQPGRLDGPTEAHPPALSRSSGTRGLGGFAGPVVVAPVAHR